MYYLGTVGLQVKDYATSSWIPAADDSNKVIMVRITAIERIGHVGLYNSVTLDANKNNYINIKKENPYVIVEYGVKTFPF